jgi:tetratricopeptide (TPR) repeat protein
MAALYLLGLGAPAAPGAQTAAQQPAAATADPAVLYRDRENVASARQAAELWASEAAAGTSVDAAWKLARACYWLGTHAPERERRAALERGVKAGQQAAALQPNRPEGHFWLAANMGALAESFGLTQGIRYRGRIRDALLKVRAMDPSWQQGSADRALGWWYHQVPGWFGGSEDKAEEHLRAALRYNPQSTATLYFLAEVVREDGRRNEARELLQRVIDAPIDPDWAPEDRDFKRKAQEKLREIRDKLEVRSQKLERRSLVFAGRCHGPTQPGCAAEPPRLTPTSSGFF